jgi:hypothetical protein
MVSIISLFTLGVCFVLWSVCRCQSQNEFWETYYMTGNFEDHNDEL